jgi:hypothetical protein
MYSCVSGCLWSLRLLYLSLSSLSRTRTLSNSNSLYMFNTTVGLVNVPRSSVSRECDDFRKGGNHKTALVQFSPWLDKFSSSECLDRGLFCFVSLSLSGALSLSSLSLELFSSLDLWSSRLVQLAPVFFLSRTHLSRE